MAFWVRNTTMHWKNYKPLNGDKVGTNAQLSVWNMKKMWTALCLWMKTRSSRRFPTCFCRFCFLASFSAVQFFYLREHFKAKFLSFLHRHFGLGASRHMKKHLSLQLNSRPIPPGFRSALQWTVFSACYRQFSLLRSYCFNVTSFLASLHGIFWCRLQTVYVWRKSSAWSSSELKLIDAFVLPKTALHVNKLGLLESH